MNDAEGQGRTVSASLEVARWGNAFGVPAVAVQLRRPMVLFRPNRERTGVTVADGKTNERLRVFHPDPVMHEDTLVATDVLSPCTVEADPAGLSLLVKMLVRDPNGKLDYFTSFIINPNDVLGITVIAAPDESRIVLPSA